MNNEIIFMPLRLFLSSIIFILGAYLIQVLSKLNKWGKFADKTKNIMLALSILSLFGFAMFTLFK
ncbi:hypothetical protein FJZ19_03985 [Candidatus Pacearchaeota archaeon]|nr:hypothetical protein [Candidatus Pacearchaeota archaeon]